MRLEDLRLRVTLFGIAFGIMYLLWFAYEYCERFQDRKTITIGDNGREVLLNVCISQ